jgi:hypothetical protein
MEYGNGWQFVAFTCFGLLVRVGFYGFIVWWALQMARSLRDVTAELRGMRQSLDRASMKDSG